MIIGFYLYMGADNEFFIKWLCDAGISKKHAEQIHEAIDTWCNNFIF